jgi:hypothetical protein
VLVLCVFAEDLNCRVKAEGRCVAQGHEQVMAGDDTGTTLYLGEWV